MHLKKTKFMGLSDKEADSFWVYQGTNIEFTGYISEHASTYGNKFNTCIKDKTYTIELVNKEKLRKQKPIWVWDGSNVIYDGPLNEQLKILEQDPTQFAFHNKYSFKVELQEFCLEPIRFSGLKNRQRSRWFNAGSLEVYKGAFPKDFRSNFIAYVTGWSTYSGFPSAIEFELEPEKKISLVNQHDPSCKPAKERAVKRKRKASEPEQETTSQGQYLLSPNDSFFRPVANQPSNMQYIDETEFLFPLSMGSDSIL